MKTNSKKDKETKVSKIYISIDHLKKGNYQLNVLKKDKVVKQLSLRV